MEQEKLNRFKLKVKLIAKVGIEALKYNVYRARKLKEIEESKEKQKEGGNN